MSEQVTDGECGKQHVVPAVAGRVVAGEHTQPGEWPWQVGIIQNLNRRNELELMLKHPTCGGTLLNARSVLTAAHCFVSSQDPKDYYIRVADNDVSVSEPQEELVKVRKVIIHTAYKYPSYKDDIAILILERDVYIKDKVNVACLPDSNEILTPCYVTGWGRTTVSGDDKKYSAKLQKARLPIVRNDKCNRTIAVAWRKMHGHQRRKKRVVNPEVGPEITEGMLCAGFASGGRDACEGDSGGPFVCKQGGRYVIKGIVSWGVSTDCAVPGTYGVYTRVYKYLEWIKNNAF